MAIVCNITDGTTTIDLTTSSGFQLLDDYIPVISRPTGDGSIPPYIYENLPCRIIATSDNTLASILQDFHTLQKRADEFWFDQLQYTPVWFHMKLDEESNERRALIKSLDLTPQINWFDCITGTDQWWTPVTIILERHPYWERTTSRGFPQETPTAAVSVTYDYTSAGTVGTAYDPAGDTGARISAMSIAPLLGDVTNELGRIWVGIRSAYKHGTLANFINIWECEDADATLGTDAARAADATASPGGGGNTKVTITPGTATWAERLAITLGDVTTDESDNYGEFLWLLRAKVSAGTWEVQFRFGHEAMSDDDHIKGEVIQITSTSWNIYEIGIQRIPIRNLQAMLDTNIADISDATFQIQVWARRTVGAGTLDIDCICPIPTDEGFFSSAGMTLNSDVGDNDYLGISTSPQDVIFPFTFERSTAPSGLKAFPNFTVYNFRLPPGDGRMIAAYARDSTSDITDAIEFNRSVVVRTGAFYERWCSLRGTE